MLAGRTQASQASQFTEESFALFLGLVRELLRSPDDLFTHALI